MNIIDETGSAYPWFATLLTFVIIFLVTWIIAKAATAILRRTMFSKENDLPSGTIFINIIRVFIWFIGLAAILKYCFSIDAAGIIAALGVGGIAISLGFQDTLLNLIGGLQISLGKLVQPGDYIEVLKTAGKVKDITWRHTLLLDEEGDEHLLPNSLMNKNEIVRLDPSRDIDIDLLVAPGCDIEALSDILVEHATQAARNTAQLSPQGVRVIWNGVVYGGMQGILRVSIMRGSATSLELRNAVSRSVAPYLGFVES